MLTVQEWATTLDDKAAILAAKLWEVSALRHGLFTPNEFLKLCRDVLKVELAAQFEMDLKIGRDSVAGCIWCIGKLKDAETENSLLRAELEEAKKAHQIDNKRWHTAYDDLRADLKAADVLSKIPMEKTK